MHKMQKSLLVTTAKIEDHARVLASYSLLQQHNIDLEIVITSEESCGYVELINWDLNSHIRILPEEHCFTNVSCKLLSAKKFLPSLQDLLAYLGSKNEYMNVGYYNADIDLTQDLDSVADLLSRSLSRMHCLFREDHAGQECLGRYYHGIDMFVGTPAMMRKCAGRVGRYQGYRMALPGWDYKLPLIMEPTSIRFNRRIRLIHQTHKSTCSQLWGRNILQLAIETRQSKIFRLLQRLVHMNRSFCTDITIYLLAKVSFFLIVMPMLQRQGWLITRKPYVWGGSQW